MGRRCFRDVGHRCWVEVTFVGPPDARGREGGTREEEIAAILLEGQGAQPLTLRVRRESDEDSHLHSEVMEMAPAERAGRSATLTGCPLPRWSCMGRARWLWLTSRAGKTMQPGTRKIGRR